MSKKVYTLIAVMLMAVASYAQNTLKGMVTDQETGEPLIGANIIIKGTVVGTVTDLDGSFELSSSVALPYRVVISYTGFGTREEEITESDASLSISLTARGVLGEEVVVSASRVEERLLESPVTIEKLDIQAIQASSSADYYDEINKLKGVHSNQASLTFNTINTRGFGGAGNTRFVQLMDGMDNAAPLLNFPTGNIVGIGELDIQGVELVPGAASALYGPNAFNGILLMNSKNPFDYPGLSAQVKAGTLNADNFSDGAEPYYNLGIRYAHKFSDKFAAKINFSILRAQDWIADDYRTDRNLLAAAADDPSINPTFADGQPLPENFDGLNTYGDEVQIFLPTWSPVQGALVQALGPVFAPVIQAQNPGLSDEQALAFAQAALNQNIPLLNPVDIRRTGIAEGVLLDNGDAESIKGDIALHYRANSNLELSYNYRIGAGSTVYQGSERYALRNLSQEFHKLEARGSNYFIRAYGSFTNDGDSYNLTALGALANEGFAPSAAAWVPTYLGTYAGTVIGAALQNGLNVDQLQQLPNYAAITALAHQEARASADALMPAAGSPEYQAIIEQVRTNLFQSGGAGFIDNSRLYHAEFNYDFDPLINDKTLSLMVGGNFRQYSLFTDGTIFNEDPDGTGVNQRINIDEYGGYFQASKRLLPGERLKLTGSLRYDKNENFDGQVSPRVSAVYSAGADRQYNFRASYQTGFRNPTTQDQFIFFPTTNTIIGGTPANAERYGLYGPGGSWTLNSYNQFVGALLSGASQEQAFSLLEDADVAYVKPEQLKSFELGFKGVFNGDLMVDLNWYYNTYNDFLGEQLVVNQNEVIHKGAVYAQSLLAGGSPRTFALKTNFKEELTSWGIGLGLTYRLSTHLEAFGNYSFADFSLDEAAEGGDLIAGFNTPNNRYTIGVTGRKLSKHFGFNVAYRWQEEFYYASSFGRGNMPAFGVLDASVSYRIPDLKTVVKLGGTNLGGPDYRTNVGNPFIGQMYYISLTFDEFMPR